MFGTRHIGTNIRPRRFIAAMLAVLLFLPAVFLLSSCEAELDLPEGEIEYVLDDGGTFYRVASCGTYTGKKVVIPAEINGIPVKFIDSYAFAFNTYIEEVVLPETISLISSRAFYHCVNLQKIDLTSVLIGLSAFEGCESLESVSVARASDISEYAFAYCDKLNSLAFYGEYPDTSGNDLIVVNSIEPSWMEYGKQDTLTVNRYGYNDNKFITSFDKLDYVTTINVVDENEYLASYDGVVYNKDFTELLRCPEGKTGTLKIPATVKSISNNAFSNCSKIEKIELEEGNTAFKLIDGVLFSMDESVLVLCPTSKSEKVTFYANTTSLRNAGDVAQFLNTKYFEVHPDNPEFSSKDGLLLSKDGSTLILVPPGKNGNFTVPDYVKNIEDSAFFCSSLSKIVFKSELEDCTHISFLYCDSLKSVSLPEGITYIDSEGFVGCTSLETVDIPQSVVHINEKAFADCVNLKKVNFADTENWALSNQVYGTESRSEEECNIEMDVSEARMAAWYLKHAYWRYEWEKTNN